MNDDNHFWGPTNHFVHIHQIQPTHIRPFQRQKFELIKVTISKLFCVEITIQNN